MKRLLVMLLFATACSASAPPAAPVVAASSMPPPKDLPEPPPAEVACENGFVEIVTAGVTQRYQLGRELVPNKRGAKHAFVEEVIHGKSDIVLSLEGIESADAPGGHVAISIANFREPRSLPAIYEHARVEHGQIAFDSRIELTSWGDVGEWVEGTFWNGRFRVCRTADWHAFKK